MVSSHSLTTLFGAWLSILNSTPLLFRTATRSYFVFLPGVPGSVSHTSHPGISSSLHLPVFLTCTVSFCPSISTSAINRLGLLRKIPGVMLLYFITITFPNNHYYLLVPVFNRFTSDCLIKHHISNPIKYDLIK